jgi:hypothetical protein
MSQKVFKAGCVAIDPGNVILTTGKWTSWELLCKRDPSSWLSCPNNSQRSCTVMGNIISLENQSLKTTGGLVKARYDGGPEMVIDFMR